MGVVWEHEDTCIFALGGDQESVSLRVWAGVHGCIAGTRYWTVINLLFFHFQG